MTSALDDDLQLHRQAEQKDGVEDDDQDRGAEQPAEDAAPAARQRDAAHHRRHDRIEFEAAADPVVDDADIAAQHQAGDRREGAGDHIADDGDAVGVDADQTRGRRIAADDVDLAAEARLGQQHAEDDRQHEHEHHVVGHAMPGRRADRVGSSGGTLPDGAPCV